MIWYILIPIVALFIFNGFLSTFARLQRLLVSDSEATSAFLQYIREHPGEWMVSGPGIKGSRRILIADMNLANYGLKFIDPRAYRRAMRSQKPIYFYYMYVGKGSLSAAEKTMFRSIKNSVKW